MTPPSFGTKVVDGSSVHWTVFQCVASYNTSQGVVHTALLYKADGTCKVDDLSTYIITP